MIGKGRQVQEPVATQDGFDHQIDPIAYNGERDSVFVAAASQSNNSFVNWQASGKVDQRVPVDLDQLNLAGETFLTRNITADPASLPLAPLGGRKSFQDGISPIHRGNGSIKITKNLGHANRPRSMMISLGDRLIVQRDLFCQGCT